MFVMAGASHVQCEAGAYEDQVWGLEFEFSFVCFFFWDFGLGFKMLSCCFLGCLLICFSTNGAQGIIPSYDAIRNSKGC